MKKIKGYSIALQMLIIPILLTIGIFLVPGAITQIIGINVFYELGKNEVRLIYGLTAFVGSIVTGGIIGYIFSSKSKKPESAEARYMGILFPFVYALIIAVLAAILSRGNINSRWWSIYFWKNPTFFIFDFGLAFSGFHFIIPLAELSAYAGFIAGFIISEHRSKTAIKNRVSRNLKLGWAALCSILIIFTLYKSWGAINNGILEIKYGSSTVGSELTEADLTKIIPFKEKNGLATLDGRASLQFTSFEEMPRLDGATAVYPVYASFVQAVYKGLGDYYEANKGNTDKDIFLAFIDSSSFPLNIIKCSKTADAYNKLINGETDIIFTAEPSKSQIDAAKAKGEEFKLTPIGSEAFVFFTNVKNPVENLSIKQIQDIYSGVITNWKTVGGQNKQILPYQRPEDSGSQTIMQNKVMKDIKMIEPTKETYAGGMGEVISRVASYQNAKNSIGYSFMYYSSTMVKNNQIKYISLDGVRPAPETVRNKKYPFTIPVYAVTLKSNSNANVTRFIDWILSDEGQSLIEKTGYIPVR